jgi:hypothetical protein
VCRQLPKAALDVGSDEIDLKQEEDAMQVEFAKAVLGIALALFLAWPCIASTDTAHYEEQEGNKDADKKKDNQENKNAYTKLHIRVTAGEDASPISSAQVEVLSEEEGVSYHKSVRTDHEGRVDMDVPRGKVWVQVTAPHWDTGGTKRKLKEQDETVEINLRRKPPAD